MARLFAGERCRRQADRSPLLLNVNLPNVPAERIRGVSLTRFGQRTYMDVVQRRGRWSAKVLLDRTGQARMGARERGLDVWAVRRRRISITPVHTDLTADGAPRAVRDVTRQGAQHRSGGSQLPAATPIGRASQDSYGIKN